MASSIVEMPLAVFLPDIDSLLFCICNNGCIENFPEALVLSGSSAVLPLDLCKCIICVKAKTSC
jgi:hypothetical protein